MSDGLSEEGRKGLESEDGAVPREIREAIARVLRKAQESAQTQWLAVVEDVQTVDPLRCYAACDSRDRYFWERALEDSCFAAWGSVDEIESAGTRRFRDVDTWASDLLARLHWVGAKRPETSPLFLGGFGFADQDVSPSEWKSFPAARFVLPETLVEKFCGQPRWLEFLRIDPAADVAGIESDWSNRARRRARAPQEAGPSHRFETALEHGSESSIGSWPPGPEYRVRSDRPHVVFMQQVARALDGIEKGGLEKVVLARSLRVDHDGDVDVPVFLERLREMYPTCTLIAVGRGEDTFLAATPETLVRVEGDRLGTVALAGSASRGRTPDEDAALASRLQSDPKERAEHAHVVAAICDALAPHCETIEAGEEPALRALFGIQHLETPIQGRLVAGAPGILGLVADLHPTPAVGGVPRVAAADWLRRFEGLDRGWYAAPIGWLDASATRGGDFSVGLRSALIRCCGSGAERASRAWLFAGAGIVAGSEPEKELAETRIKLRALLAPLTEI